MIQVRVVPFDPVTGLPDENLRVWLAGQPGLTMSQHSSVANERRELPRAQQEVSGSEWEAVGYVDRGNGRILFTFETTRRFDAALDRWRWMNLWGRANQAAWPHPIQGNVVMRFATGADTFEEEVITCEIAGEQVGALMQRPTMIPEGETLRLSYAVRGSFCEAYRTGTMWHVKSSNITPAEVTTDTLLVGDGSTYQIDLATDGVPDASFSFEVDTNASLVNPGYTAISATTPAADMAAVMVAAGVDAEAVSTYVLRIRTAALAANESVLFSGSGLPGPELYSYSDNNGATFTGIRITDNTGALVVQEILD